MLLIIHPFYFFIHLTIITIINLILFIFLASFFLKYILYILIFTICAYLSTGFLMSIIIWLCQLHNYNSYLIRHRFIWLYYLFIYNILNLSLQILGHVQILILRLYLFKRASRFDRFA